MGGSGFPPVLIFFIFLQQLVFVIACVGNGLVIFVFLKYLKLKTMTNRFVLNLAIADFFTGISSFSQIFYFLYPTLSKQMITCFLRYQIIALMTLASILTVAFTTFDRFISICFPHNYKKIMTSTTTNSLIALAWVYSFILTQFPYTGLHSWTPEAPCVYRQIFMKPTYALAAFTLWVLSIFTFTLYLFILKKAWNYFKRIKSVSRNDTGFAIRNRKTEKDVRMAKVMGVVTVAFTVCWAPYSTCQFRYGFPQDYYTYEECNWLVFLGLINSMMNPFIYAIQRRDFNAAIRKMFKCLREGEITTSTIDGPSHTTAIRPSS